MTTRCKAGEVLIIRTDEGGYYTVPRSVVERALVGEEHRAELTALIERGDVSNFSAGVLLPYFGDRGDDYYALPPEAIDQYRVPPERAAEVEAALESSDDEVQGHGWCPPGYKSISIFLGMSAFGSPIYAHTCVPDPRVQARIAPASPFVKL
jgi:hypothetical protein